MQIGEGNGKIYVGMPRERILFPEFVDDLNIILNNLHTAGLYCGHYWAGGHRVDRNRDRIVEVFLREKKKPEWLLMLDTDMEHPDTIGERLVKHQKPIVGGLYFHRNKYHDPFTFKKAPPIKDSYGREQRMWQPMRDEVYDFLIKKTGIPMMDTAVVIEGVDGLFEVDAVATGAMLIHRSVLEAMSPGPWFEYEEGGISEDLAFCDKAREKYGFPVYCDFCTISGHYALTPMGYAQFKQLYEARGYNFSFYSPSEAITMVSEFTKEPRKKVAKRLKKGSAHSFGDYWQEQGFDLENPKEERMVYRDPKMGYKYLEELIFWNASEPFNKFRQRFMNIREKNILEIGAGIGTFALQMVMQNNNVTAVEVNPILRDFIKFRHDKVEQECGTVLGKLKILGDDWNEVDHNQYHMAFAIDVFEHLPLDDLKTIMSILAERIIPTGRLHYHANFGQQDLYPMHHDYSEEWDKILSDSGFYRLSNYEAVRL